ncbi:hypothetical protein EKE94_07510 [Mesobaculum littorinae]|uniref:DUF995 domain-containing protein n=1 Tax=Mesobaculum littorinae TaxID=2486419 RepID=A0A438AJ55_9RHOB|nr:hypothetical protein [Mesobaculum littorinae]RVV98740.1 hypothetical protein EKE94_07510 [Mesobaculum littorinae]
MLRPTALASLLTLLAAPLPALAQDAMSAAEFDAYTRGKTLYFSNGGVPYGIEQYLPGRQVLWSFLEGECKTGSWYERDGMICFEYEDGLSPQCWEFYREGPGLRARFEGDPEETLLYETRSADAPLQCNGPMLGV